MKSKIYNPFVGVGLRNQHYPYLEAHTPQYVNWFEAITENYLDTLGRPLEVLLKLRETYPIALHGVALSIATPELDRAYLKRLQKLIDRIEPFIVSDHLCFNRTPHQSTHDLLPFPMNQDAMRVMTQNILQVQDYLKREIVLENISYYLSWNDDVIGEAEFISELVSHTGCKILLDLNNIYVNSQNFKFNADTYLKKIPFTSVAQVHLAGFTALPEHLFDNHVGPIPLPVWNLFERYAHLLLECPVLIEWDEELPPFEILEAEAKLVGEKLLATQKRVNTDPQYYTFTATAPARMEVLMETLQSPPNSAYGECLTEFVSSIADSTLDRSSSSGQSQKWTPGGTLTKQGSMEVYQNGYLGRLTETLYETFEAVSSVVGDCEFFDLAREYIRLNPSSSYNLSDYGESFPGFLGSHSNPVFSKLLRDLAQFEWHFKLLFHTQSPDINFPMNPTPLSEESILIFPPSVTLLSFETSVYALWKTRKAQKFLPLWDSPENLLLYKIHSKIFIHPITSAESQLIASLKMGTSLGSALTLYEEKLDPARIERIFALLNQTGVQPQ